MTGAQRAVDAEGESFRQSRIVATEFEPAADESDTTERTRPFRSLISDPDAVEFSGADAPSTAQSIDTECDDTQGFALRVMTGPSAGRELALDKDESIIGRVGVSVARIRREGDSVTLFFVEGPEQPVHNGAPVRPEGVSLAPSDTFVVAGTCIELVRR